MMESWMMPQMDRTTPHSDSLGPQIAMAGICKGNRGQTYLTASSGF